MTVDTQTSHLEGWGYTHDRRADKYPYPHNCCADKDSYPHDRNVLNDCRSDVSPVTILM